MNCKKSLHVDTHTIYIHRDNVVCTQGRGKSVCVCVYTGKGSVQVWHRCLGICEGVGNIIMSAYKCTLINKCVCVCLSIEYVRMSLCVYLCIHVSVHICLCERVHMCVHVCVCLSIEYVRMSVCVYLCIHVSVHICLCERVHMCVHVCVCVV